MGTALSGSVCPSLYPCKEQTWLVRCTWDIVPGTVDIHGCPRDVTEQQAGGSVGKRGRGPDSQPQN